MPRPKHRNDKNHGKNGWMGGNPRHGKARGNWRGRRAAERQALRRELKQGA